MKKVFFLNNRYKVKTMVITGGPCSGKTTIVGKLRKQFGNRAVFVPEAATLLLSGGFPLPGRDLVMCPEWQDSFQATIVTVQLNMEEMYRRVARQSDIRLMVCDRGVLDGAAYTPGGIANFPFRHRLDLKKMLARYDRVIHLESLATAAPEKYGKVNNEHRGESLAQAKALEYRTQYAWECHPKRLILLRKHYPEDDDVFNKVAQVVQELLN